MVPIRTFLAEERDNSFQGFSADQLAFKCQFFDWIVSKNLLYPKMMQIKFPAVLFHHLSLMIHRHQLMPHHRA